MLVYCELFSLIFFVALCPDPAAIINGRVTFTGTSVGDTATYTCNLGLELIGGVTTTCTQVNANSAAFSPNPPSCRRKYCINESIEWLHVPASKNHNKTFTETFPPPPQKKRLQWNLRIKDTLGARLLSFIRRLSSGGRFDSICYF